MDGVVITFIAGYVLGLATAALCVAAGDADEDMERTAMIVAVTDDGLVGHAMCDRCGGAAELCDSYCSCCGARFEGVRRC